MSLTGHEAMTSANPLLDDAVMLEPGDAGVAPIGLAPDGAELGGALTQPRVRRKWVVLIAAFWLILLALLAVLAGVLPLRDPTKMSADLSLPPGLRWPEFLGTDDLGRSELSRIIYGARVSLAIGLGATFGGLLVGTVFGLLAGYFKGWVEAVVDTIMTAMLAFPPLIFLLALTAVLKPDLRSLVVALSLVSVPMFYRIVRATTLTSVSRDYVLAARSMGASNRRILVRELLPAVMLPAMSYAVIFAAVIIVAEGSLSFLGLGIRPPDPSWGGMVASGQEYLDETPHLVLVPALAFIFTVFSLNVIGDWARARVGRGKGETS